MFNVLHVVSRMPVGGVETAVCREILAYDTSRFRSTVCCMMEGGEMAEELQKAGYRVDILGGMKGRGFAVRVIRDLYRLMKRDNIHILRTHQYHANLYGRIAGILAGVAVMIPTFHNLYVSPGRPKMHRRVLNGILGFFSDALIGVSDAVSADVLRYDWPQKGKVKTIYNGVRLSDYDPGISRQQARAALDLPADGPVIGTIGRLTEQKGHRYLIEAASGVRDACLVIAGDGPLGPDLKTLAAERGVRAFFPGAIRPNQVPVFLRAFDIFCFPSLWEGFGIALVEAMAAGLPVVATDILPHREVLGNAGFLVPAAGPRGIAEAINRLIREPQLRAEYARKAKERSSVFSLERMIAAYEELFIAGLRAKGVAV